ncbi:uncharacterized protein LOC133295652 [Gastrolobium bilobum]|uniref:uncharacterized protein LOC133295652 n=1 Tax=Gastrolobium bilobum TaxID=150636 RepID=UPI002AB0CCB2|nr:uncharacterized protein LOC133295652 [Gastrolobium bilobum]
MAWNVGFRKVVIESDSSSVVTVLTRSGATVRENQLISRIRTWLDRSWSVFVQHTLREANTCADWLANFIIDHGNQDDRLVWGEPPPGLIPLLNANMASVGRPRVLGCNS